ncbi:hypothetical protein BC939DRAFT_474359 [Gamsiella multidivaricata]|uniref:uncharacterized protein n=1 Tax=Gamsiella multidivaricata TaxID=101098 RepID=UPI0022208B23|nr:uncharacterized protein BC939DRAFT_474359 [Gamsiella multidivaricata]KAG0367772.1 hypothetical protein BGZ54_003265 [Gamsiella multidivaricata]KAI7829450.1 hypothetical protein BC939DRAFT_474359 [Gamsiella multidivaricata]
MSSSNKPVLLLECLQHVLSFLQFNQVPTLLSLMRVNKTLFQLTVPILYQNPFLLVRTHRFLSEDEKADILVVLLRLFISELDPALQEELPPRIADDDDEDQDEASNDSSVGRTLEKSFSAQNGGYFYHYRRQDHAFLAAKAIPRLFGTITRVQSRAILAQLDVLFLKHCGHRVVSFCLTSTHVPQFYKLIPVLGCLKRLEVHHIKKITESSLAALVDWIRQHDNVHGTLRELQIGGLTEFNDYDVGDLKDLIQLPLAFKNLYALDTRSWSEAWTMIDQIPVEALERLVLDYGEGHAPKNGTNFLLRCRSLKYLDLFIPEHDTFMGVARLFKVRHQIITQDDPDTILGTFSGGQEAVVPPVERLYISGNHVNLRNALEDAGVGLSQSLRVLKATSFERHRATKSSLTWGRPLEIQMPFLQDLQFHGDIALEFDFSLLRCCPNLTSLKLVVNGDESCGQEGNPLDGILSLSKLQTLQLLGRWPLTKGFVRAIPVKLTGLKILDLAWCTEVQLDEVMEAVHKMEFLWRLGWDLVEIQDPEEVLVRWQTRAPQIRLGFIHWDEFFA